MVCVPIVPKGNSKIKGISRPMRISRILRTSLVYAASVFCVGFALGSIRVFLVVPRIGTRWAELLEAPLMLFASFLAARITTHRYGPFARAQRVVIGVFALAFMLLAEVSFVLAQGFSIPEYIASRDPVSGTAYLLSLAVFTALPLLVGLGRGPSTSFHEDGPP